MLTLIATLRKEWTLLFRDKIGLLILLLLPTLLVLFISLSHGGKKDQSLSVLIADRDQSALSQNISKRLSNIPSLKLMPIKSQNLTLTGAESAVTNGQYRALIVIPQNFSKTLQKSIQNSKTNPTQLELLTDPAINPALQANLRMPIELLLKNLEVQLLRKTSAAANTSIQLLSTRALTLAKSRIKPNSVQQNVPAWALFGMFFILIPMAGNMVREREFGVYQRLQIAPALKLDILLEIGRAHV